ncbi:MAG TPA: selenide, water dikinase SelD [Terriglobia bacterium]|nr:selenide, water dikinase SelD [Terriglobia bacterium]
MSPSILDSVLSRLPKQADPNVLVGFETADDAGVYQLPATLAPNLALVQTVDFFTPVVDDPFTFGQIAAANSLSDIYAMGGRPLTALAIAGFPNSRAQVQILEQILQGGLAKMQEAACTVIGGHSIGDEEIKFGYAVTGLIDPRRVLSNSTAQAGDHLLLTKRIGTGVIGTALKKNKAGDESVRAAIESMCALNRTASEIALKYDVHSATDVTGFGLLGHAREMAAGSKVSLRIDSSQVDFLPGALESSREGFLPGGLTRNIEYVSACVEFAATVLEPVRNLLYDPQTSGGLLLSVAPADAGKLLSELADRGIPCREIGFVVEKTKPLIAVE